MIRAEFAIKAPDATTTDFRIDRGRLTKRYTRGALTLSEQFGATTIPVAAGARVLLNGKPATVRSLRAGMQVAVPQANNQPATDVYASGAKASWPKVPRSVISSVFSGKMLRAEIGLKSADGVIHDYFLDRGRIKQVTALAVVLREADGNIVTVPTAPFIRVKINGKDASYTQLRRGMMATTMHDRDKPADQIWATGT